ncbi:cytochrome c1 [Pacificimonas sp. WHA3]|uniref:Cytochrome c1 n=1 Tax=Pacificimonas pallii TaxID=2827236 RepID=A0ABS6SBP2_9SPHN|nr:cytochrome c1 [Pacificimonas pallii]MBV7255838.1 cytochrome c1 [Pacificimonas pallii]
MFRFISYAIGATFIFVLILAGYTDLKAAADAETSESDQVREEYHKYNKSVDWSWNGNMGLGVFGGFDNQQLQRGFQVYKDVCSGCHSLKRVAFRNLQEIGFNEAEVKQIATDWVVEVPSINPDTGEADTRPATLADKFPEVYPNEIAARAANNNALPPDMSLIAKSRPDGSNYLYSLITGYEPVPASFPESQKQEGLNYNPHFHSLWIAMPPQLSDGLVEYADGTPATIDQMGKDVAAFLTWAAEPKMEERKQAGIGTIIFLLIFTGLAYIAYRRVWADQKH